MTQSRRGFLRHSAVGALLLTFNIAGCEKKLTPADARATGIKYRTLTEAEAATLEALGEMLLPGSAKAGLAHYVDHQLSGDPADSMLMIKYLRVPAPFIDFYRAGFKAAESVARIELGKSIKSLTAEQAASFATQMAAGKLAGWEGPPAPFFFFVVRNDAVDVTYSTQEGFQQLGVPYMAHIPPPSPWGA